MQESMFEGYQGNKITTIFGTCNGQGITKKVNDVGNELKHLKKRYNDLDGDKEKWRGSDNWRIYYYFYSDVPRDMHRQLKQNIWNK